MAILMLISIWMAVFLQLRISVEIQTTNLMDHTASHKILGLDGNTAMYHGAKVLRNSSATDSLHLLLSQIIKMPS